MVKKNPQSKFKKLLLTWWVWVIIAIVSYFIFASIPITWNESGFGWDTFAGLNFLKTILAYFTQIAWVMAVSLLVVSGIKYIQKTKMNDYWKISLTILGIVLIIAYVIYSIAGFGIFDRFSAINDERIGDLDNAKEIKIQIELLEGDGYEVDYFYYALPNSSLEAGSLTMKSLGNRNDQIWQGLFALNRVYPDAHSYTIRIIEPTKECWYRLSGNLYRNYLLSTQATDQKIVINGTEYDSLMIFGYLEDEIKKQTNSCS